MATSPWTTFSSTTTAWSRGCSTSATSPTRRSSSTSPSALGSLGSTLQGDDLFRVFRLFLDGYRSVTPLEPEELAVLGDTVALRAAMTLCISHWRAAEHPENATYIQAWDEISLSLLRQFKELGPEGVTQRLGGPVPAPDTADLARRRASVFGTALAPLSYSHPLHLVSGRGATMTDSDGTTYIDAYNNVPVVGHAHPRVSGRISDQARVLSTNLRYLHPRAIELAERLLATVPPELDTVLLVNSGSEATDLAWRLAMAATGRSGALVTDFAYHGVTTAATALSPEEWRGGWKPDNVERFAAPQGQGADVDPFDGAVAQAPSSRARAGTRHRRHDVHQRRHPQPWRRPTTRRSAQPPATPGRWSWPTRCRPASAGRASISGRSSAPGSCPTWSPWASRWGTATRWPR